jgi:MGT family glycosyltransferase
MSKKNYLMTVWEGGGNVPPVLAVAKKLLGAGHAVRIMSDACNGPEIHASGATVRAFSRAPSRPDKSPATDIIRDWQETGPQALARVIDRIMCGPAWAYAADTLAELEREPADAVITNEMLFGVMAAAELSQIPFALLCPNISLAPMPGVPPLGPGLLPAKTPAEEDAYARINEGTAALFNRGLPALNAARTALGLAPLAHVYEQWNKAALTLLATARAFDFAPAQLPPNVAYVGPQFDNPDRDEDWVSPWAGTPDTRPLVLVSFSTTHQAQEAALGRVLDAARGLDLRFLVTLGPALDAKGFAAPDNVKLIASAPHRIAMRDAAVVVCHGGHGTVSRALSCARPQLVMPMGRDQNDNAARVAARGAGLVLDPAQAKSDEIAAALTRLVNEPAFAAAAQRLGKAVDAEAQASRVVPLIEMLGAREMAGTAA